MLRAVIFDLDGVIVNSHPAHLQAWKALLASLDRSVSEGDLLFAMGGYKRDVILQYFLGELSAEEVKEYGAKKDALFRASARDLKTVAGFPGFFASVQAAGLPIAVASSASRWRVESTLKRLGIQRGFRAIVTGDDVAESKPDPAIFQLAARSLGISPADILVCEDAVAGIQGAKRAGMKCLAIAAEGHAALLREAGADYVIPDFREAKLARLRGLFDDSP